MTDVIICILNLIISLFGAYISYGVKNSNFPEYYACVSGIFLAILWAFASKHTCLRLIVASAIFSSICQIGSIIGYIFMGTKMSPYNYIGILLILIGILFLHIES
jgi:multidrug transporter EmrE-like cation transporter